MIDVSKLKYKVLVVASNGTKYNITDFIQDLGWEENENEIAVRSSFKARNNKTSKGYLSSVVKNGSLIIIYASAGGKEKETARGYVETWKNVNENSSHDVSCTMYDEMYKLQKSQDNFYFSSGKTTVARIKKILKKWKVKIGTIECPKKRLGKKKYEKAYLSDILTDIMERVHEKTGKEYVMRMEKSKCCIRKLGSNEDVYHFTSNNSKVMSNSRSTADLVTKVKVLGKAKKKKRAKVIYTLKGMTQYGIRQRIYQRSSDETKKEAKKSAQEILDDKGDVKKDIQLQAPDVPFIRKGDLVHADVGSLQGYYYVTAVVHDCDTYSMTLTLKAKSKSKISKNKNSSSGSGKSDKDSFDQGDVVTFKGGTHYVSNKKGSKGYKATAGKAKITKVSANAAHPYHLIHTDSKSNVYGWVDEGTFS